MVFECTAMNPGMHNYMSYGLIFQLSIFIIFFLIVWWLLRSNKIASQITNDPLTILKKRFANGEITKKEYESIKKELEK